MKTLCLLLLSFITITGHAQMTLDVPVEPKPLDFAIRVLEPELKSPMKSMVWVRGSDTLISNNLDKKGNVITQHNYSNNKRANSTVHSYNGSLKTQSVYTDLSERVTTTYKYTPSGKYLEWGKQRVITQKNLHAQNGDFRWVFGYDGKDNLIKKYRVDAANVKTLNSEYAYDTNNKLKEAVINGQWKSVFEYDSKGNLLSRTEALNGSGSSVQAYGYDQSGNVVKTSNKYYTAEYSYENGKMGKCIYTLANGKQEIIDFNYKDGLLSEVNVRKNGPMSYSPFRPDRNYELYSYPYTYKIEILYDSHKNTKELKYYINGDYKYSEKFLIQYYK